MTSEQLYSCAGPPDHETDLPLENVLSYIFTKKGVGVNVPTPFINSLSIGTGGQCEVIITMTKADRVWAVQFTKAEAGFGPDEGSCLAPLRGCLDSLRGAP